MESLTLDIETVPLLRELSEIQNDELNKKLKKYYRGTEEVSTDEYEDTKRMLMATNPLLGEIVCIGLMKTNDIGQYDTLSLIGEEADILDRFWKQLKTFSGLYISYNGLNFDVPYIIKRSMKHKILPTNNNFLNTKRFLKFPHFDVMQVLADFNPMQYATLKLACESFGIASPKEGEIKAENVAEAFRDGRIKEIAEYCLKDVVATYKLYAMTKQYVYVNKRY